MRLAARCPCLAARARPAALGGAGAAGCGPRVGQRRERLCPAAQAVLRNSMTPEQRLAMVQAHRRARRQLAAIHSARPRCRTVASELLSDDPSFRGRAAHPPHCRCPGRRTCVYVAVQHAPGRGPCLGAGGRPHARPGGTRRAVRIAGAGRSVAAAFRWGGVWSGADARRGARGAQAAGVCAGAGGAGAAAGAADGGAGDVRRAALHPVLHPVPVPGAALPHFPPFFSRFLAHRLQACAADGRVCSRVRPRALGGCH